MGLEKLHRFMQKLIRIILIFCRPAVPHKLSLHCVCNTNSLDNVCFTEARSLTFNLSFSFIMKKQQLGLNLCQNYQTIKQNVEKSDQFSLYILHNLYALHIVHNLISEVLPHMLQPIMYQSLKCRL